MLILGVFASGNGSNCQALVRAMEEGKLDAVIGLIVSNNTDAGVLAYARQKAIPCLHIASEQFESKDLFYEHLLAALKQHRIEMIVLAGYMKKIGKQLLQAYPNKILNIHPALLPAFGGKGMFGRHVHEAVIEYGAKITGVTVHLVDSEYDHGPIVMQQVTEVRDDDTPETLARRVLELEHQTYYRAIQLFAGKKIEIIARKVINH